MSNIVKSNAIIPTNLEDLQRIARMCAESGFFQDARQLAQACVKIAAGAEYGVPPIVSMAKVNIIKGRVSISAEIMASSMKHAGYKLKVRFEGEQICTITVIDPDGIELGDSTFSMDDAKRAGLLGGEGWRKYPRNMLYARAVSNAARWFAPEVLTGAITPEELGGDENAAQEYEPISEPPPSPIPPPQQIAPPPSEPVFEASFEEEEPLPPTSEIRNLNPRATMVKKIHARLREVGLDHDELKKLLPEAWSFKTASESDLDCVNAILQCRSLDELRQQWNFLTKNSLASGLTEVKNYMKAALEARA